MSKDEVFQTDERSLKLMSEIKLAVGSKDWRKADSKIMEFLQHEPNNPDALMYLGISKAAQGYEPEGEHHLLASLTFNPKNKIAYYYLGIIVMEQGRCMLASEAFRKGLSIDPHNHSLHYQMGRALERLGNYNEAIYAYEQALNTDSSAGIIDADFYAQSQEALVRLQESGSRADAETCKE
ncbi:MAG: tetratricopeptide repeat protein [Candidatus Thorarchaeota archaeon]